MTDRYAVIGNPIVQSKSPLIHGLFAKASGQDLEYGRIEARLDGFADAVRAFRESGGRGLNITAPFKLQAFELADRKSPRATAAGAVNAYRFDGDAILAENFDGIGLVNDIQHNLATPLRGRRVLLLGAGGAAHGALLPFVDEQPGEIVIANRRPERAEELAAAAGGRCPVRGGGYADIGPGRFDIVVNATSASLHGELPPVPASAFSPDGLAYELAYGKGLTPFLRMARDAGTAKVADGVGMLIEQAAEAFLWWRGVRPETRAVIEQLTVPLI